MTFFFERAGLAAALLVAASVCSAHHSAAMFDTTSRVTVTGVVSKYEWTNPHIHLYVESESGTGERIAWEIEAHPPTVLKRLGWSPSSFSAGDSVVAIGDPDRNPSRHVLRLREVRRADGMRLVSDFPESTSNDKSPDQSTGDALSGTWLSIPDLQMSAKLTYSGSASLPSTPKGAAALRAFARELDPGEDCLPSTAPIAMIFPDIKRIDTDGPVIRVRTDHDGIERIVHMDVDSHDDSKPSLQGHSIGRWEGRVLIVDTQRFVDHATGNGYSLPSGQRKHLIERFELDPDGRSLTYRFELEDPEYLTAPVTGEAEWDYRPDLQPSPEQCAVEYARRFLSD